MKTRFQNAEIEAVNNLYAENHLYKAVCKIGPQLEAELTEFGLCPEECFAETQELLTVIAEKGEEVIPELQNLWLMKFNQYRRFDRDETKKRCAKPSASSSASPYLPSTPAATRSIISP